MVKSMTLAAQIPHFHYVEEINCNALFQLKTSLQKENSDPSIKYTLLPVLIKSLSMALTKYPLINSCLSEGLQEVTLKGTFLFLPLAPSWNEILLWCGFLHHVAVHFDLAVFGNMDFQLLLHKY